MKHHKNGSRVFVLFIRHSYSPFRSSLVLASRCVCGACISSCQGSGWEDRDRYRMNLGCCHCREPGTSNNIASAARARDEKPFSASGKTVQSFFFHAMSLPALCTRKTEHLTGVRRATLVHRCTRYMLADVPLFIFFFRSVPSTSDCAMQTPSALVLRTH